MPQRDEFMIADFEEFTARLEVRVVLAVITTRFYIGLIIAWLGITGASFLIAEKS